MSPLFMESGSEYNSTGSFSDEECQGPATGMDKRGEKQQSTEKTGRRKEKNKSAARKSRKKQTERADVLHEELQCLERSNTALENEIAALKREYQHYATALEQHQPHCCLRTSSSSSSSPSPSSNLATTYPSASPCPSTHLPASTSPAEASTSPAEASTSPAEAPLPSTARLSLPPSVPLQTSYSSLDTHHPSAPACQTTTSHLTPSTQPPAGLLSRSDAAISAALRSCSNPSSVPRQMSRSSLDTILSAVASLAANSVPISSSIPTTTNMLSSTSSCSYPPFLPSSTSSNHLLPGTSSTSTAAPLSHVGHRTSPGTSSRPRANTPFPPAHTRLASSLSPTTTSMTAQTAQTGHGIFPLTPSALTDIRTSAAVLPSSSPATMNVMPHSGIVNALLTEQFSLASSSPLNHLSLSSPSLLTSAKPENASVVPQSCAENTHPGHLGPLPQYSSPPNGVLPSCSQDSTLQSLLAPSINPQTIWHPCSTPTFTPSPSFTQLNATSLLSLLTVPSPIIAPQTTSSNLIAPSYAPGSISASHLLPSATTSPGFPSFSTHIPFPSPVADSSRELSELLEDCGDWMLDPTSSGWDV